MLVDFVIAYLVLRLLLYTGVIEYTVFEKPLIWFMMIDAMSLFIGLLTTTICSTILFKPIREILTAMKDLSNGNFNIRIKQSKFYRPRELREFSNEFNNMAKELGSIEMLRSDFINDFSHEFKTPIVSLRGFAKLLKEGNVTDEEKEEYLDIIISESNRLSILATNVLNLSKIENQAIIKEKDTFDLSEQIRRVILMMESKWAQKEINLDINLEEINYYGNKELLSQVWVNLLDNAIKFSPKGGDLEINLKDYNDHVEFKLQDYGCGMDAETQAHIFDKFYQGDTSRTTEGNGLGMALVKKIISLHQGNITIKSEPGHGTLVMITLFHQSLKN